MSTPWAALIAASSPGSTRTGLVGMTGSVVGVPIASNILSNRGATGDRRRHRQHPSRLGQHLEGVGYPVRQVPARTGRGHDHGVAAAELDLAVKDDDELVLVAMAMHGWAEPTIGHHLDGSQGAYITRRCLDRGQLAEDMKV